MVTRILAAFTVLTLAVSLPEVSFAQAQGTSKQKTNGPRKQITIIVFSGIAGAVLGLSTLSFYGRPQDKLHNIAYGFAVGIIIGAGYSAYAVTTQPREFSRGAALWEEQERDREQRFARVGEPLKLSWAWHF